MRRHDQTTVLVALTAGFFVTYYLRMAISPVVPFISAEFGVSNGTIGLALTGMWLGYGLVQYPSGILGDRFGERTVVLLAVGGSTVSALLLALAPAFAVFVVLVIAFGGLAGLHYSPATTLLSRTHDDIGRAVGVHLLGSPAAGLLAPVVSAWVGVRLGWRAALATALVVGVPTLALVRWGVPDPSPRHADAAIRDRLRAGAGIRVLTRPAVLFTLGIVMVGTFVIQALLSFLPTFLIEHREVSATTAGVGFSAFFVLRAGSQFALGSLSDRFGRDVAVTLAMASASVGLAAMVLGPANLAVALGIGLAGFGMGFYAVTDPRFLDVLGEEERGSGFGVVRTVYTVFGSAGSVSAGVTADLLGWDVAFLGLATMLGCAALATFVNRALGLGY